MTGNRLNLNDEKNEALVFGSCMRISVSQDNHVSVGNHDISLKIHFKSLRVYINATLSMATQIDNICRSAYVRIRGVSSIRHLLTRRSQSLGLLQLFTHWHHFRSNVPSPKNSKSCSQSRFWQKQTRAC